MKILKPTLLGLCNLLGFSLTLHAQVQITESTPLQEQIEDALAPLDMSAVTTQILYDKGMDFYDWTKFGDSLFPDSLATTADSWGWHFAQLISSCLDEYDPLPDPDGYMSIMSALNASSTTIPIASMLVDYHRFHPDAIGLGLLTYDSINQTFHNVTGQNPYLRDTFFVATLLGREVYAGTIDIVMPDSLQIGNLPTPDSMEIDLGQGWTTVGYNQTIPVTYAAGEQYISLRFNLSDGSQWYAKTSLTVHPVIAESSPPSNGEYSFTPDQTISEVNGASFNIFYGNDCEKLLKPFIFIEGFNPSQFDIRWQDMRRILWAESLNGQNIVTPTGNTAWQDLYNEGYDLIYVDFDDGAGDIFFNAGVVEDIIEWVNDEKASNGSLEKNIVLGASMGGVIGYRALRTMEISNEDHQTEYFISYDSPMYGANVPLGLQYMVKYLGDFTLLQLPNLPPIKLKFVVSSLGDSEDVLLSPAAKQMLYYHAYAPGITAWHDNFYTALHADGPLEVKHIAISNGSSIGENQVLSPGEQYLKFEGETNIPAIEDILASLKIEYSEVYAMNPPTSPWKVLYKHKIKKKILNTWLTETVEVKNTTFSKLYDSAPGGVSNLSLDDALDDESLSIFVLFFNIFEANLSLSNSGAFGFIPTVSALNIAGNPDPMTDLEGDCSGNNLYRCFASTDDSVILPYTMSGEHNQDHVSLNSDIATFLLYFYKKGSNGSEINPLTDRTFNFGETDEELEIDLNVLKYYSTIDLIDFNLLVEEQGQLWVNRDDRIDFTDIQDNPLNNSSYHFDLYIAKNICNSTNTTVTIQSGGELVVGDWNGSTNTASVFVEDGATLLIKDGGFVSVDKDSEIVINDGGKLKIEEGGKLRATLGAQIVVEEGGSIEIDEGAEIDLWWAASTIHIKKGGELIINGEFDFGGAGFFQFDEDHILTLNADFVLHGQGDRFIRLNENAELKIGDRLIELKSGKVEYAANASISVGAGSVFT